MGQSQLPTLPYISSSDVAMRNRKAPVNEGSPKEACRGAWVGLGRTTRFVALAALASAAACSAGDAGEDGPGRGKGGPSGAGANSPGAPFQSDDTDDVIVSGGPDSPGGTIVPPGSNNYMGGELLCDGVDENNNGIIDDVDVGMDGLCDCIQLGFFGKIASDAGSNTGQFEAWLDERAGGAQDFKQLGATDTLTAQWLSDLQVLIIGGMQDRTQRPAFSSDEMKAISDWVNQGGGLVTLAGYTANSDAAVPTSDLLSNFGLSYDIQSAPGAGIISETVNAGPPVWLTGITAPDHPTVSGVSQIGFFYGYPVSGEGTVILEDRGYALAVAKQVGNGRVFAFGDEWITQDQTWSGVSLGQSADCQACNEATGRCEGAKNRCESCEMEPCSDPNDSLPDCQKGCTQGCEQETQSCTDLQDQCDACREVALRRADATARLWLNTLRWLTPETVCQVPIPPPDVFIQ